MKYQEHFKFASASERNIGHQEMTMEDMDNYISPQKGIKLRTTQLQKLFENSSQIPEDKQKGMSQKQKIYSQILQLSSFTYALVSFASVSHMVPSAPHILPVNRHILLSEPKIALIKCIIQRYYCSGPNIANDKRRNLIYNKSSLT